MIHAKKLFPAVLTALFILVLGLITIQSRPGQTPSENIGEVYLEYSHGVTSPDPEQGIIKCAGDCASFDYTFCNGDLPSNFGLLLFLDGMIQPYSTSEDNTAQVMHIFELQPAEEKTVSILFTPISQTVSQSSLYITAIYDAQNNLVDAANSNPFAHHLSQTLPFWVEHVSAQSQLSYESIEFSPHIVQNLDTYYSEYNELPEYGLIAMNFGSCEDKPSLCLRVYATEDSDADYRIYLFENHTPVIWENQMYQDIHIAAHSYTEMTLELDCLSTESFYYAIAVPLGIEDRWNAPHVQKSESITCSSSFAMQQNATIS